MSHAGVGLFLDFRAQNIDLGFEMMGFAVDELLVTSSLLWSKCQEKHGISSVSYTHLTLPTNREV